jgi:hypothetical protein
MTLLNGTVHTATTNSTGIWKISNLPVGFYPTTVSYGYQSVSFSLTAVAGQTRLSALTL